MPQKSVFSRAPLLTVQHCFPAPGTVRTGDPRISGLYEKANSYIDRPCLWEGLFRIACLIKNKPADEPVTALIEAASAEQESGTLCGRFTEQIHKARAMYALFEYNTDKRILVRIAQWLRYVEVEFDNLIRNDTVLYHPADLMELLVRFYQTTGIKSALRICARLRAESFDWTTALHTFQQSIPVRQATGDNTYRIPDTKPEEIDYLQKEKLINHAEMLADGLRYTMFSGMFSGHGMDLSAGRTVWPYLKKHHHALCGGTTGDPFLSGNGADQPVNNMALCAWTEAFCSQMMVKDCNWSADELIRIIYNGLDDCLNRDHAFRTQMINTITDQEAVTDNPEHFFARITRAAAAAFHHGVSLTDNGFVIHYLLPAKYMLMVQKQPMIMEVEDHKATFRCKKTVSAKTGIYFAKTETRSVHILRGNHELGQYKSEQEQGTGRMIETRQVWHDGDVIAFLPENRIIQERTHHQGLAFISGNRVLSLPVNNGFQFRTVCNRPVVKNNRITALTAPTEQWRMNGEQPGDIPVLPGIKEEKETNELIPYSSCRKRITMFPGTKDYV